MAAMTTTNVDTIERCDPRDAIFNPIGNSSPGMYSVGLILRLEYPTTFPGSQSSEVKNPLDLRCGSANRIESKRTAAAFGMCDPRSLIYIYS